jgi:hypothetical protein
MKELIAEARDEAVRRRELELLREVRREVEQMVRTVEFNDPYIDVQDAFKWSGISQFRRSWTELSFSKFTNVAVSTDSIWAFRFQYSQLIGCRYIAQATLRRLGESFFFRQCKEKATSFKLFAMIFVSI